MHGAGLVLLREEKEKDILEYRGQYLMGYSNETFSVSCNCKMTVITMPPPSLPLVVPTLSPPPSNNDTAPITNASHAESTTTITETTAATNQTETVIPSPFPIMPSFVGSSHLVLLCRDFSRFHPDMALLPGGVEKGMVDTLLNATTRKPSWNRKKSGTFNGKRSFDTWFRNGPWNVAKKVLKLEGKPGSQEKEFIYGGDSFFPFDTERNRDEGTHNFYFSCEHHGAFVFEEKSNQRITFKADDDLWVFINDKLSVDVGGIHDTETRVLDLNELGLANGQLHTIDLFFAQRRPVKSSLELKSNFDMRCALGYDACGVCKLKSNVPYPKTCPPDLSFLGTQGERSYSAVQNNADSNADSPNQQQQQQQQLPYVRCDSVSPGEPCDDVKASLKGLGECSLDQNERRKKYTLSLYTREVNPIKDPHALVVTLDHYGSSIRRRGTWRQFVGRRSIRLERLCSFLETHIFPTLIRIWTFSLFLLTITNPRL